MEVRKDTATISPHTFGNKQHTYHITYPRGNTSTQNSTIYYNKISNFSFETAFLMLVVAFNLVAEDEWISWNRWGLQSFFW